MKKTSHSDNLNLKGGQLHRKVMPYALQEDDLTGGQLNRKKTSQKEDLKGRRYHRKDITVRKPPRKMT